MAGFNATLDQVEQMIQSNEIAQLQEAKRMLDELCLPADSTEFIKNVGMDDAITFTLAMMGNEKYIPKLSEMLKTGLSRTLDLYFSLGQEFWQYMGLAKDGGHSEEYFHFIEQAKSCHQAALELTHEINLYHQAGLELTHEINPYHQGLQDFLILQYNLELAKVAAVEHNTELFHKHLKACYELPDQPDDAEFMRMKQVARKLPEQLAAALAPSATDDKPKSATNPPSSTSGEIDQTKIIGIIATVVIVLLLLYACGAA